MVNYSNQQLYTKILLPIIIVMNIYSTVSAIPQLMANSNINFPSYYIIFLIYSFATEIGYEVLAIVAYIGMRSLKTWSLKTNYCLLIIYPGIMTSSRVLELPANGNYSFDIVLISIIPMIVALLNFIYFEKRRYLFDDSTMPPEAFIAKNGSTKFKGKAYRSAIIKLMALTFGFVIAVAAVFYGLVDKHYGFYSTGSDIVETETSNAEMQEKAEKIAAAAGCESFDELIRNIEESPAYQGYQHER